MADERIPYIISCQNLAARYYKLSRQWRNYCDDWSISRTDFYYLAYEEVTETAMLYARTARLYMGVEE